MENLRSDNLIDNPLEEKLISVIQDKGDHLHAFTRDADVYLSGEVSCRATKEEISCLVKAFPAFEESPTISVLSFRKKEGQLSIFKFLIGEHKTGSARSTAFPVFY
jgi:hypothetical protein